MAIDYQQTIFENGQISLGATWLGSPACEYWQSDRIALRYRLIEDSTASLSVKMGRLVWAKER